MSDKSKVLKEEKVVFVNAKFKPAIKDELEKGNKLFYDVMRLHGMCLDLKPMPEAQYEMIKEHAKKQGIAITDYYNVYKKEMNYTKKQAAEEDITGEVSGK